MEKKRNFRDKSRETTYKVTESTTLLPFLLDVVKGKSRNNVKSLLSRKLVTVDGKPTSQFDTPLTPGQEITILSVPAPRQDALPFPLLYEDEHLIVVNKPAKRWEGMVDKITWAVVAAVIAFLLGRIGL